LTKKNFKERTPILADFRRQKLAILTILEALNFFLISQLKMSKLPKIEKSELLKWTK